MKIRHAHHESCIQGHDFSVKREVLTTQQKDYCKNLFAKGSSPQDIHRSIVNESDPSLNLCFSDGSFPSLEQIQTYKKNYHRESEYKRNTVGVIRGLCQEMSSVPQDEDEPHVISYQIISPDDFNIVMSTKRLLKLFSVTIRRNVDGTYKLLKSGHPVIVMGVDDANRVYHPSILSLTATEQGRCFITADSSLFFICVSTCRSHHATSLLVTCF